MFGKLFGIHSGEGIMPQSVGEVPRIGLLNNSVVVLPVSQKVEELVFALGNGNFMGLSPVVESIHESCSGEACTQ